MNSPKINNFFNLISCITFSKAINFFRLKISYWISLIVKKPVHWGYPAGMSIEPGNACNLRCPECPTGNRTLSRPVGQLDFVTLEKAISTCKNTLIHLFLYFQGEPYLNPDFFKMVQYLKKQKLYVATSTNGHFLDDISAKNTIKSGLDKIIISLDGIDHESYTAYRIGGDFEEVLNGIKRLMFWKKELQSKTPFVEIQFLVLNTNEYQIDDIKQLARQLGVDKISLKTAQLYDFENGHTLMPKNDKFSRYREVGSGRYAIKSKLANHCFRMWSSCVITWNGEVVPCCFDKDCKNSYGNMNEEPVYRLWKSTKAHDFRNRIFFSRKSISICSNCSEGLRA